MSRFKIKSWLPRRLWPSYDALGMWVADALYMRLYSPPTRIILGTRKRIVARRIARSNLPFCIDVRAEMGFGAVLKNVLLLHHTFDSNPGLKKIISSNPLYLSNDPKKDVLDLFFDRLDPDWTERCQTIQFDCEFDISTRLLGESLSIQRAHSLFAAHYSVKQNFLQEARSFLGSGGGRVLGVHFRSGDKRQETPGIPWERYTNTVDTLLDRGDWDSIFVASDLAAFVQFMEQRYGAGRVRALSSTFLSEGPVAAHFRAGDGFKKGREALLTALILSMCGICVRGHSFLSAFSKILNPALPIVMLGKPYPPIPFPEVEILRESADWKNRFLETLQLPAAN